MLTSVPLLRRHFGSAPSFGAGTSVLELKSQHTYDHFGETAQENRDIAESYSLSKKHKKILVHLDMQDT
jgi:hypothetical protein